MTPWTGSCQAPLSMGFPKQEYWSGLPFPSPGDLSEPRMELSTLVSPALTGGFFITAEVCGQVQSQGINSTPSEAMARVWRKQGVKSTPSKIYHSKFCKL